MIVGIGRPAAAKVLGRQDVGWARWAPLEAEESANTSTAIGGARTLAERLKGFGGLHTGGLQQVKSRRPNLSDKRTGL